MSGLGIIGHANNMYGRKTVIGIVNKEINNIVNKEIINKENNTI